MHFKTGMLQYQKIQYIQVQTSGISMARVIFQDLEKGQEIIKKRVQKIKFQVFQIKLEKLIPFNVHYYEFHLKFVRT